MPFREQQLAIFEAIKNTQQIPELLHETNLEFVVSSFDDVILPLILDKDIIIVAGAYFGDEAKGKTTDAIAHNDLISLVVRYNSGENAGHTVYLDGQKYVFHLTP